MSRAIIYCERCDKLDAQAAGAGHGHWSRGDALWLDAVVGNNVFNAADGDQVIVGPIPANGTTGTILGGAHPFRYVDRAADPAGYQSGDDIYSIHFDRDLYTDSRNFVILHEGPGHCMELDHEAVGIRGTAAINTASLFMVAVLLR